MSAEVQDDLDSRVSDYMVVTEYDRDRLNKEVNSLVQKGWQPLGGISVSPYVYTQGGETCHDTCFAQAMVKTLFTKYTESMKSRVDALYRLIALADQLNESEINSLDLSLRDHLVQHYLRAGVSARELAPRFGLTEGRISQIRKSGHLKREKHG
jgi:hypothetical protein